MVAVWLVHLDTEPPHSDGFDTSHLGSLGMHDRRRSIARRWLRSLLARHMGTAAERLELGVGKWGKPELIGRPGAPAFNLAHSGPWACITIGEVAAIGVDLEQIRPVPDAVSLARRYLPRRMAEELACMAPARRDRAFLKAWTQEEALRKAQGTGLTERHQGMTFGDGSRWFVRSLDLPGPLVGSIAASDRIAAVDIVTIDNRDRDLPAVA